VLKAAPAGGSWYHGHVATTLMSGNRGLIVLRKRPADDPYFGE
jgi:hypothetical protein